MSNLSARDWSIQYESIKKRIQSIRSQTLQVSTEDLKTITATVNNLDNQLKTMSESPSRYDLVASEIARRQVLIESLKKLLSDGSIKEKRGISATPDPDNKPEYNPMVMSDKALAQKQKDTMKLQDDMLLDIEKGVGRLHEKALEIGDEAKSHTRLLDDLDSNVDLATAALQAEAKHAEKIKEQTQMCWLYICCAVEVIVLFLLIVVMLTT